MPEGPKSKIFGDESHPERPDVDGSGQRHALPGTGAAASSRAHRDERGGDEPVAPAAHEDIDYNPNRFRGIVPLTLALVLVVVGGVFAWNTLGLSLPSFSSSGGDYEGSGSDETGEVTIEKGDAGSTIGEKLVAAGITKSTSKFVEAMAADPKANIQPGTYRLKKKQSAMSALEALQNEKNRMGGVTIPEGLWQSEIFARLAKATNHSVKEYEAVSASELGLPKSMNGKLEGWLYPSTYDFTNKTTPKEQLQTMVKTTKEQLQSLNVNADQFQTVLTKASIVQAESPAGADMGKVARVVENRMKGSETQGKLQMDSSVHYVIHKRGTVTTTDAERNNPSPYNTYVHKGLPPTPYNSPGLDAIKAAVKPTPGPWYYFVTVNQQTGETLFATTYAEQQKNEQKFREWCKQNPSKGC